MLAIATPIVAAAYLLLSGQVADTAPDRAIAPSVTIAGSTVDCQRPAPPRGHLTVRWVGWHHHRHCRRTHRGWRCR